MKLFHAIKRAQKHQQGVSLLVTIIFVTIFLLVIVGLGQSMLFSIRDIRDFSRHDELTSLARGAADLINQEINEAGREGIGLSGSSDEIDCAASNAPAATGINIYTEALLNILCENPATRFSFSVEARPEAANAFLVGAADTFYSLPLKGTGQATSRCVDIEDRNDPCHWNVISIGETVEIPLFYNENNSVNDVGNPPSGSSSLQFQLRLRTPSPAHENLFLDQTRPGHWQGDPTLVNWQIISESGTLKPNRDIETNRNLDTYGVRTAANSEIYASKINTVMASDNVAFNQSAQGEEVNGDEQSINDFLTGLDDDEHPVLRLQLSAIPKKSDWIVDNQRSTTALIDRQNALAHIVPYLEYQILVNNNNISDEKRIVRVTVTRGGISQTYEKTAYYGRVSAPTSLEDL